MVKLLIRFVVGLVIVVAVLLRLIDQARVFPLVLTGCFLVAVFVVARIYGILSRDQ
jgi:hypothetical protein